MLFSIDKWNQSVSQTILYFSEGLVSSEAKCPVEVSTFSSIDHCLGRDASTPPLNAEILIVEHHRDNRDENILS